MEEINNKPTNFGQIGKGIGDALDFSIGLVGLADHSTELTTQASDRLSAGGAGYLTTVDQAAVPPVQAGTYKREMTVSARDIPGTKRTQGERFFLLKNGTWNVGTNWLGLLEDIDVSSIANDPDFSIDGLTKYHAFARFGVEVIVQINPTPFQQGCLCAALVPGSLGNMSYASMPVATSGFLNCNTNNIVRMRVPWVYTRGMYNLHNPVYSPWRLALVNWSNLFVGSGTTTSVTYTILARFVTLELHGIRPYVQMRKPLTVIGPCQGVMNLANTEDARAIYSLALEDEHFMPDDSMCGGLRVTDFKQWYTVPTLMTRFAFNAGAAIGAEIASWDVKPIYPAELPPHQNAMSYIANQFAYWRGDIVYDFQVMATKYHSGRLLVVYLPGENTTYKPTLRSASMGICAVFDIAGPQSTFRFRVPWIHDTPYMLTGSNSTSNGAVGSLAVYVYNRLAHPANVIAHVYLNVLVSGQDMEFYCPLFEVPTAQAGDDTVESAVKVMPVGSIEDKTTLEKNTGTFPEVPMGVVTHSKSHTNIYNYMGRAHWGFEFNFNKNNTVATLPLSFSYWTHQAESLSGTWEWFMGLFQLYRGPLDMQIGFTGGADVDGVIWFTPIGLKSDAPGLQTPSITNSRKYGIGLMRFNTHFTKSVSVQLPWYTYLHAISAHTGSTHADGVFGQVSIQITSYTTADEYLRANVSFSLPKEAQCFVARPVPVVNYVTDGSGTYPARASYTTTYSLNPNILKQVQAAEMRRGIELSTNRIIPIDLTDGHVNVTNPEQAYAEAGVLDTRALLGTDTWRRNFMAFWAGTRGNVNASDKLIEVLDEPEEDKPMAQAGDGTSVDGDLFPDGTLVTMDFPRCKRVVHGIVVSGRVVYINPGTKRVEHGSPVNWRWTSASEISSKPHLLELLRFVGCSLDDATFDLFSTNHVAWLNQTFHGYNEDEVSTKLRLLEYYQPGYKDKVQLYFRDLDHTRIKSRVENLDEAVTDVSSAAKVFQKMIDPMAKASGKIYDKTSEIIDDAKEASSKLLQILSDIKDAFAQSRHWITAGKVLTRIIQSVLLYRICSMCEWKASIVTHVIALAGLELLNGVLPSMINAMVTKDLTEVVLDTLAAEGMPQAQSLRDKLSFLSLAGSALRGVDTLLKWLKKVLVVIIEKCGFISRMKYDPKVIASYVCAIDEMEVKENLLKEDYVWLSHTMSTLRTWKSHVLGHDGEVNTVMLNALDRAINKAAKLTAGHEVLVNPVARPEPSVIYLHGERGSGKSLAAVAIAAALAKECDMTPEEGIYSRPPTSDFWDGYKGQPVVVLDDFGQSSDDADWREFCQLISSAPLRVNMAHLEHKGRAFESPFIVMTSNLTDPEPRTVYSAEAVKRRLHQEVSVRPNPYYLTTTGTKAQKGCLDTEKALKDGTLVTLECLRFERDGELVNINDIVETAMCRVKIGNEVTASLLRQFGKPMAQMGVDAETHSPFCQCKVCKRPIPLGKEYRTVLDKLTVGHVNWPKVMGLLAGAVSMIAAGYYLYQWMKPDVVNDQAPYGGVAVKVPGVVQLGKEQVEAVSQSTIETAALAQGNTVRVGVGQNEEEVVWYVCGLGVAENRILIPRHFINTFFPAAPYLFLRRGNIAYVVGWEKVLMTDVGDGSMDVVMITVPGIPPFRDITEHFIQEKDVKAAVGCTALMATIVGTTHQLVTEDMLELLPEFSYETLQGTIIKNGRTWKAKGETASGMCGGALVVSNTKIQTPICGIHVAGAHRPPRAYAALVTREMLQETPKAQMRITEVELSDYVVPYCRKTAFEKTAYSELLDEDKQPAILSNSDARSQVDMEWNLLKKLDRDEYEEPNMYDHAAEMVSGVLAMALPPDYRPLSIEEAAFGIDGLDPVDMNTSAGYPYIREGIRKRDMLRSENGWISDRLRGDTDYVMNEWLAGRVPDVDFCTFPKDELRSLAKIAAGDTRYIEASPIHVVLAFRMLFGQTIASIHQAAKDNFPICVGMDVERNWHWMVRSFEGFSRVLDLDFVAFDSCIQSYMIQRAMEVMATGSGLPKQTVAAIAQTFSTTYRRVGRLRMKVTGSLPSGMPATSVVNSIINWMNFKYVMSKCGIFSLGKQVACFRCYGDDVLIGIRDGVPFDIDKFVSWYGKLGFKVTGADKQPITDFKGILDAQFLKRKTVWSPTLSLFLPAIDEKTIKSLFYWKRRGSPMEQNVHNALWFAYLHGRPVFDKWRRLALKRAREYQLQIPTWLEMHAYAVNFYTGMTVAKFFPTPPVTSE